MSPLACSKLLVPGLEGSQCWQLLCWLVNPGHGRAAGAGDSPAAMVHSGKYSQVSRLIPAPWRGELWPDHNHQISWIFLKFFLIYAANLS